MMFALGHALQAPPLLAQGAPAVVSTTQRINFPTDISFSALVENGGQLSEAILFYRVLPEGPITRQVAEISHGEVTRLGARIPTAGVGTWIPAGSTFEWNWRLIDTNGDSVDTDDELFQYDDPRYEWVPIENERLVLFYYGDNRGTAERLHREGSEVIESMSALLGVQLDFQARVYMWASPADASGVEQIESQGFEEEVITGGTRVLAELVHRFQPTSWGVRHELTHILTMVAGEGGIGSIPAWLDEGTATYSEIDWRARRGAALNFAIETDQLFSIRGLTSPTNEPGRVDIFYGQSGDIVTYLITTFGEESFAELFSVFKHGSTVDDALQEVYGLDRDRLTDAYRVFVGLEALALAEDRSTVIEDEPINPISTPTETDEGAEASPKKQPIGESAEANDAAESPAARTNETIEARRAEIEDRLATRRVGPVFEIGGHVPWAGVVAGVGGAALLIGLLLLWVLLRESERRTAWQDVPTLAADAGELPLVPSTEAPPSSLPSVMPRRSRGDGTDVWTGWQRSDD